MLTILNLFGKSPFAAILSHMEKVSVCVYLLPELFRALKEKNHSLVAEISEKISQHEHQADLTKNSIRNHLPKSIFLAIDRSSLLEILALQDSIADKCEDIAVLLTLKEIPVIDSFWNDFELFLKKNIETFEDAFLIIKELHQLLESSFGGVEADKVRHLVDKVAYKEHEADLIQRNLLKAFFQAERELTLSTFHIWIRIFEAVGSLSNTSEKLGNRIRMTLEIK